MLHQIEGLAGAEPGGGRAENGRRGVQIVTGDQLGTLDLPDIDQGAQRYHLSQLVADIKIFYVPGLQAVAAVGLNVDLEHLVVFVEQVDERGAQICLEGVKHIGRRDLQGLRLGPVDIQVELRAADAQGGGKTPQAGLRISLLDEFVRGPLELGQTESAAVFNHQLETSRLAQSPDRRRNHHKSLRFLDSGKLAVDVRDDPVLVQGGAPFFPVLINDEGRRDIGHIGAVQYRQTPDVDPEIDSRGFLEDGIDFVRHLP